MREYLKTDINGFLPSITYRKMNWIILIDNSGSMGTHAMEPSNLAIYSKNAIVNLIHLRHEET